MEKFSNILKESTIIDTTFDENEKITSEMKVKNFSYEIVYVGHWYDGYKRWYGLPVKNWKGWDDKDLFDTFLYKLKNKISQSSGSYCRGYSICRICGKTNGSKEHVITDNGTYIKIPEGYIHYIEDHKIQPHKWFLDYIINS